MEARVLSLNDVLIERQRWCVPVYQRHYAWETGEAGQLTRLWEDLEEKADEILAGGVAYPHYIGAILVAEPPNQPFGTVRQRLLVDGQQRITTFQLVLAALREVASRSKADRHLPVIQTYLFNELSGGMSQPNVERYKLWPSSFDRKLYQDIVDNPSPKLRSIYPSQFYKNGNLKVGQAARLLSAYWYLVETVEAFVSVSDNGEVDPQKRLDALLRGFLSGFRAVIIQLDDKDDAQEIFASLNGLGKPLTPFDLVRNDVFHRARLAGEDDEAIFEGNWKTFEDPFWQEETRQGRFKKARIDFFLGHMLVAETAKETNLGKLAAAYETYARERKFASVAEEIRHIVQYVPAYRSLSQGSGTGDVEDIGEMLRIWDLTTFYPLVFHIAVQDIADEQRRAAFWLLKAYIIRREMCDLTSKNYNNVVLRCIQRLRSVGTSAGALLALFQEMQGDATRMPSDEEVIQTFGQRRVYGAMPTPRLRFILGAIEHGLRTSFDESVALTSVLTVEHVMPQRWAEKWPLPDGRFAPTESSVIATITHKVDGPMQEQIAAREKLVDSIGNLTLVTGSLNPSMGKESFVDKKLQLAKSLLVLNRDVASAGTWDETIIRDRGIRLAAMAARTWAAVDQSTLLAG